MYQNTIVDQKNVDLLFKGEEEEANTTFLSKTFIGSYMITHYILEQKWCLAKNVTPAARHLAWITKVDK